MIKILIVDDKPENLYLLEYLLKGNGFDTMTAGNGKEALALARNDLPDLIISDILMPVMDGFVFCRECKGDKSLKDIPFIFYTATYTDHKDEEYALSLGADRFILKPQDPDVFLEIIQKVMNDAKENKRHPASTSGQSESFVLKQYNEVLIRKLEDKMTQTEEYAKELREINASLEKEIIERKRAEDKIRESEERYRSIYENIGTGILLTVPDGRIISANSYACKLFGRTEDEICRSGREGLVDMTDPRLQILLEERKLKGNAKGELIFIRKDGTTFEGEISSFIFHDSEGKEKTSMLIQDVTERKRAEEELARYRDHLEELVRDRTVLLSASEENLKRARDQADAANKAKTVFLSIMSHEIRTPLNAVLGFSQLMLREDTLTVQQKEWIATINRSGEHLLALINDILEISRIETGKASLNPDLFDLGGFLSDLEKMFRSRVSEKNIGLNLILEQNLPQFIEVDGNKLRQIFINLVGNAVKFTDSGIVTVRVQVKKNMDGKSCLIAEVEDTGPGINLSDIENIFETFKQSAIGIKKGGTGLGLAISRQLARLMGGDITVKSEQGKGSSFHLELDFKEGEKPVLRETTKGKYVTGLEKGQNVYRVLIVDDEPANRALLMALLAKTGFAVEEAANGMEALERYQSKLPDLIFLDMGMPEMGGYEVVKKIKSMDNNRHVPIVSVSASAFTENKDEILQAGVDGYIRKPYKIHEIFDALQSFLGIRFTYREEDVESVDENVMIAQESLAVLTDNLVKEILEASRRLDIDRLLELMDEAERVSLQAAQFLRNLVKNYRYDDVIKAFEARGL